MQKEVSALSGWQMAQWYQMKKINTMTRGAAILLIGVFSTITTFSQQLTFEEAVKLGLKKNVTYNQQKNQLIVNESQRLNSLGNFMPSLNVTGNYNHQSGQQQNTTTGDLEDLETDYFGAQVNAGLTVFNGFRNITSYTQQSNQLMAQSYLVKRSAQDVVSLVANQYLQVLLDQQLLKIAEENLKTQQSLLEQTQGFFDVGSRAITDVYNQDALLKTAQVAVIRARSNLVNDKAALAQTLQLDPSVPLEVTMPQFSDKVGNYANYTVDSLIAISVNNRSDLRQMEYQVKANKFSMMSASSGFLPSVTLYASYGSFYYSLIPNDFSEQFKTFNPSMSYGANLTIPIFNRFQTRNQRIVAKVTYENSKLNQENLEKSVRVDVQRAYNNLLNALEGYQSSLSQFQAGELALQTQKESYELGISTQVELAQANQTYILGAASKAQAEVTLLFQKILLEYALGTLRVEDFIEE
jgi:outer membrane protein